MRDESLYLDDIVEAADHIAEFIAGADFDAFQKSEMLWSAVAFRNILIHATSGSTGMWCGLAGGQESLPGFTGACRRIRAAEPGAPRMTMAGHEKKVWQHHDGTRAWRPFARGSSLLPWEIRSTR